MTGVTLTVDDAAVEGALGGLLATLDNLRPVLVNIGEHVVATTVDRFNRQVAPNGTPWAPLNPEYAKGKKGPGILRETGQLSHIVYQAAEASVDIGTNAIHAKAHQFGAVIRPKTAAALVFTLGGRTVFAASVTIPKREFLGLTEADQVEISAIVADFLQLATSGDMAP